MSKTKIAVVTGILGVGTVTLIAIAGSVYYLGTNNTIIRSASVPTASISVGIQTLRGKNLAHTNLARISGAADTSNAFLDALDQIKQQIKI